MILWQCRVTPGGTCYEWVNVLDRERLQPPSHLMKRVRKGSPIPSSVEESPRMFKEVMLKAPPPTN